ncbi:hypothetical protein [Streptomyces sp. NPDC002994]|uniref:hypothetical protein n=1 Tax=Streptomyces sp. NPDC002994 TaxID=3154441 RepID=UPI0033A13C0D
MTTKTPARPARPAVKAEADEIFQITTSAPAPAEDDRKPLFSVDGENFTVPKKIDERLTFLAMNKIRTDGAVMGSMYLIELLLGKEQYGQLIALYEQERIKPPEFDQVTGMVSDLFFAHFKDDEPDKAGKASDAS